MANFKSNDLKAVLRVAGLPSKGEPHGGYDWRTAGLPGGGWGYNGESFNPWEQGGGRLRSPPESTASTRTDSSTTLAETYTGKYEDEPLPAWYEGFDSGEQLDKITAQERRLEAFATSVLADDEPGGSGDTSFDGDDFDEPHLQQIGGCNVLQMIQSAHAAHASASGADEDDDCEGPDGEGRRRKMFSKTRLCKFNQAGRCRKGMSCQFAHGDMEMRNTPDLTKTSICAGWARRVCPLAARECRFAHGFEDLRAEIRQNPSAAACFLGGAGYNAGHMPPLAPIAAPTYFSGQAFAAHSMSAMLGEGWNMSA